MASQSESILSRHEAKYLVSVHALDRVRRYMAPFMRPDPFAVDKEGCRYQVNSVYLDSRDLALYQMTAEGMKNRFKLRMRWYDNDVDQPVFLEIKRRVDQVVRKRRVAVGVDAARAVLQAAAGMSGGGPVDTETGSAISEFTMLAARSRVRPMLMVRYWREPYDSTGPDPLRITLDTALEYAVTTTGALLGQGEALDWKPTPHEGAIIEIKFTEVYPSWVAGLIEELQLQKQSVAKYCLSIEQVLRIGETGFGGSSMRASLGF